METLPIVLNALAAAGLILPTMFLLLHRTETRLEKKIKELSDALDRHEEHCYDRHLGLENRLTRLEAKP